LNDTTYILIQAGAWVAMLFVLYVESAALGFQEQEPAV
jgi:hypothetical protein